MGLLSFFGIFSYFSRSLGVCSFLVYYVVKSVVVVVLVFYNMRCFYLFFRERDVIKFDDILGRLFNFFVFIKVFYCVMIMCFIKKKKNIVELI